MYNLKRNDYYNNEKDYVVYTPDEISEFIFSVMNKEISKELIVFDPCVGEGSLIKPWMNTGYKTIYSDIKYQGFEGTEVKDYLKLKKEDIDFSPGIVLINPPFNSDEEMRKVTNEMGFGTRPFMPEVFLKKTLDLFGKNVPIVLFTPYGFRLNVVHNSKRIVKFFEKEYPEITSIISLPKDVYEEVNFHSEIVVFNSKKTKPHYFVDIRESRRIK